MKKLFAVLLALLLMWPGQGQEAPAPSGTTVIMTTEETMAALAQTILDSQPDRADYHLLPAEDTEFYLTELYGIPTDRRERAGLIYTVGGVDAREIAVVYVSSNGLDGSGAAGLEKYRQDRYGDFYGYVPGQAKLVWDGVVLESGGWSMLLLCSEPEKAQEALDRNHPGLALRPYDPDEELYDWTRYYDERGYRLFEPPNKVDMTLYDTTAIRAAYASGDESGLNTKDRSILAWCQLILATHITEDMTDFEKELALHDWVIDHVAYDQTTYRIPEGQPDNKNPFGALERGYGICLGYVTTFQLLMDLAGVECITVVGASADCSQDHAWNLVKLEGEWYCVDVTWDDSTHPVAEQQARSHIYFNVTSEKMRETDHQWDYDNVPEATATRFRWDGTGEKPE